MPQAQLFGPGMTKSSAGAMALQAHYTSFGGLAAWPRHGAAEGCAPSADSGGKLRGSIAKRPRMGPMPLPMGALPEPQLPLHRSHACARHPAQTIGRLGSEPHTGRLAGPAFPGHHRPAPRQWSGLNLLTPPELALALPRRAMLPA